MKKIALFSILLGVLFFAGGKNVAFAVQAGGPVAWSGWESNLENLGYSCTYYNSQHVATSVAPANSGTIDCVLITDYTYSATQPSKYSLTGVKTAVIDTKTTNWNNSPFIYFLNPPQGNIAVTLNSKLNSYFPLPSFNTTNGWNVTGDKQKGTVSIDGKEQKNLFYELAMNSVTLNRHGQNFNSKEEITSFLQNSGFFDKLGFSQEQKENSLSYVLQKLNDSKVNTKHYYLTILTDESVADISTLAIQPKPKKLIRTYFAIYPTNVPVKTEGSFVFPQKENLIKNNFTVKETGEFLVPNNMTIFFK